MAALVLAVAALICQVSAQLCNLPVLAKPTLQSPPSSPVPQISQIVPYVSVFPINNCLPTNTQFPSDVFDLPLPLTSSFITNPTPVISTTVVDNSVANSLANVLQLLLVTEFLGNSFSPAPLPSLYNNIVPLYDAIGTIGTVVSPLDVISPDVDVTTVNYNSVVDVSTVVTDVIASPGTPVSTNVNVVDVQAPLATYAPIVTEVVSPVTTYSQNVYAPVAEVYAPAPIPEVITPVTSTVTNIYGSVYDQIPLVTEVTSSISSIPTADVYTTITDYNSVVSPIINPYYSVPSCPTYVTEVTDFVAPLQVSLASPTPISYISDYYSGYADVITSVPTTVPFAAELILPQSIPAQIVCNFGYSPLNVPVVSMNVETVSPFGGYVF